jgi:uncharacterized protein (DUF1501 family)
LALAAAGSENRLVFVILRGGLDGLHAVPPVGDAGYAAARGSLAVPPPGEAEGALALDGTFALHPALAPIAPWWRSGELAIAHAAATPYRERSHFDAQDILESGATKPHVLASGWLNRAVAEAIPRLGQPSMAFGQTVPLVLRGPARVETWQPGDGAAPDDDLVARLRPLYASDPVLGPAFDQGLAGAAMSASVLGDAAEGRMGGVRGLGGGQAIRRMADAAGKLMGAADGPRIAVIDVDGWDTHAGQAARLKGQLGALAGGLVALREGLGEAWSRTLVVAATEFGRTVAANGTGGTDHGTASAVFLMGGAVKGGRMLGDWPGLAPRALLDGRDLAPANDLRAILKGVLRDHLGADRRHLDEAVFPESARVAPMEGLVRT